jgi:hypothetical protein
MGIYTKLGSALRINPLDKALARLYYCTEAIRNLQNDKFFTPKKVSIWLNAPSKTLHGREIYEDEITNFYNTTHVLQTKFKESFYREGLLSSIVLFEGEWHINNSELKGFFACNNYIAWNRAYFDVEIDAYSQGEYGDLMDLFLKNNEVPEFIKRFISNINISSQNQTITPRFIYFSRGVPEYGEVEDLIALHLKDRKDMTSFLYAKLRKTEESWVRDQVEPIDKTFYVSSLVSIESLERFFTNVVKETELIENLENSVTYIAKDTVTFSKFFECFKNTIFKPASQELPNATYLKTKMKDGLEGTKSTF